MRIFFRRAILATAVAAPFALASGTRAQSGTQAQSAANAQSDAQTQSIAPPVAERRPHVDTLHGIVRSDPYFWLREKSDPAVATYLEAENAYAGHVLAPFDALREELYTLMLGRIDQTDLSVPFRDNGYFYYTRTEEGKQYPIFARKAGSLDAPEQVLLDLNALAEGQTFMSIGAFEVSDDAQLLAYSTDSTGFRQYTLHVKDLRSGDVLADRAERVVSVAWAADNRTLFYTVEDSITKRSYRLYRHVLGSPEHELLYEEPDERFSVYVSRTRSDDYLLGRSSAVLPRPRSATCPRMIRPATGSRLHRACRAANTTSITMAITSTSR